MVEFKGHTRDCDGECQVNRNWVVNVITRNFIKDLVLRILLQMYLVLGDCSRSTR